MKTPPSAKSNRTFRAALATPPGRGAIATILVSGENPAAIVAPFFVPASGHPVDQIPAAKIVFGRWTHGNGPAEELVVCRRSAHQIEIHCHGGIAAAATIMAGLKSGGCDEVSWTELVSEFSSDPLAADARSALAAARTERTAAILLDQYHGAWRNALLNIRRLLDRREWTAVRESLHTLHSYAGVGRHLVEPWRVVLAGPPNVGKSSLINAILGYERSIVFDQPGTTRDVVTASAVLDGWPVHLSDTAGLRQSVDAIESAGIARAESELAAADLVLFIFDASELHPGNAEKFQLVLSTNIGSRCIFVLNKCDLVEGRPIERQMPASLLGAVLTSTVQNEGINILIDQIVKRLVPDAPPPGAAVPFLPRHYAAIHSVSELLQVTESPSLNTVAGMQKYLDDLLFVPAASSG